MDNELVKKKISEKNKAKKKYLEKIELLKQAYGVEFKVDNFKNNNLDKIKFYNLNYKKSVKNISLIYDVKINNFNYISYDYELEKDVKDLTNYKLIEELNNSNKLKLLIDEIIKYNNEYKLELEEIDKKYNTYSDEPKVKEIEIQEKSNTFVNTNFI